MPAHRIPPGGEKSSFHPRNRHRARYDFPALTRSFPELGPFVRPSPVGTDTIDFADPAAVTALNAALLRHHYAIERWHVPPGYLCPPIPGRADYVHHIADLLAESNGGEIPRDAGTRILDIGIGANAIFALLSVVEYGWTVVGTDIDPTALESARQIVAANPQLAGRIECRRQASPHEIFRGVTAPDERFAACVCNPPFHASAAAAAAGTDRKLRNLSGGKKPTAPTRNFGGQSNELWYPGGEAAFVRRMIVESSGRPTLCGWFTTLVSQRDNLTALQHAARTAGTAEVRTIDLTHGQKKSRILAWRFNK
jgi:23S rRNA (adenine1618-N6)-methyltransferase